MIPTKRAIFYHDSYKKSNILSWFLQKEQYFIMIPTKRAIFYHDSYKKSNILSWFLQKEQYFIMIPTNIIFNHTSNLPLETTYITLFI